mgnify:CR=1 FL=1
MDALGSSSEAPCLTYSFLFLQNFHHRRANLALRKVKKEELERRRLAATVSREIKKFWQKIERMVRVKYDRLMQQKKKELLDRHLEVRDKPISVPMKFNQIFHPQ